jgi:parvulin-like peptidyl-prolyl isomerase
MSRCIASLDLLASSVRRKTASDVGRRPWRLGIVTLAGGTLASIGLVLAQTPTPQPRPTQQPAVRQKATPAPSTTSPATTLPVAAAPAVAAPRAKSVPTAASEIVARVAGRDISAAEVRSFVAALPPERQAALARDPALLSQTLRLMLANQLILKEALEKKWDQQPAVAAQLDRLRESAIAEIYLQTVSTPPNDYPSDDDVQKAYEANKSAFLVPRQFRLAHIFIALAAGADKAAEDKARKKLAEVQSRVKQPKADFAAIAKQYSDQSDADDNGGDLGWIAETQIRPEIKAQIMGLANNAVSDVVQLSDGFHIMKLIQTKPAETRTLAEVRPILVQRLRAQRADLLRRSYLARVLEQNPPAINELGLAKVFEAPSTQGAQ